MFSELVWGGQVIPIEEDPPGKVVESFGGIELTDNGVWWLPEHDWSLCTDDDLRGARERTFKGLIDAGFGLRARAEIRGIIEDEMRERGIFEEESE